MLRRDFLKALAIVASAAALPGMAMPAHPFQKYIDALALYDNTVNAKLAGKTRDEVDYHAGEFFTFIMANFPKPAVTPENIKAVRMLLDETGGQISHERIQKVPPDIAEEFWCIIACRAMIQAQRIHVDTRTMPGFKAFVTAYKPLIIA